MRSSTLFFHSLLISLLLGCTSVPTEGLDSGTAERPGKSHDAVVDIAATDPQQGQSNCALFMNLLTRFNEGDLAGVRALLHPEFVLMNIGGSDTPWHGPRLDDADGFLRFLRLAGETTTTEKFEILHQFDAPGRCFTVGVETLRVLKNGRVNSDGIIWETHWLDGQATFLREYYDTKQLNDLFL